MRSRPNDVKKKVMLIRLMIITSLDEDKVGLSIAKSVASGETRGAPAKGKREKDEKKKKKTKNKQNLWSDADCSNDSIALQSSMRPHCSLHSSLKALPTAELDAFTRKTSWVTRSRRVLESGQRRW